MDIGEEMQMFKLVLLWVTLTVGVVAEKEGLEPLVKNPFLWKVEKGNQTAYLFGTIHIPAPELTNLPLQLRHAIARCDGVRTEIDMSFMNQLKISQLMLRKDGKPLKTLLSKNLYERTENYLKTISPALNLTPFSQLKVWALSATIGLLEDQLKHPALTVIDDTIFTYAKEQNKSVGGVETLDEQIGYFDIFTLNEQILMLESTLDFLERDRDYMKKMKNLYIQGDGKALLEYVNQQFEERKYRALEKKFMEELLYKRNRLMAKRIDALLKKNLKKSYLFAFGVMHFLDKKSVIAYLEGYGYKVTRIK